MLGLLKHVFLISLCLTWAARNFDLSNSFSLSQWPNFKLFGITYLVGKISRSNFFFQGPGRLSEHSCIHRGVFVTQKPAVRRWNPKNDGKPKLWCPKPTQLPISHTRQPKFDDETNVGYFWQGNLQEILQKFTLPETNSSPLKMDGWKTILSYWGPGLFSGVFCC